MKIDVSMSTEENRFYIHSWWATGHDFVVETLQKQLEAASAIWPELRNYTVAKKRNRTKGDAGKAGHNARAAALTPERRSEIASDAAKARWGKDT